MACCFARTGDKRMPCNNCIKANTECITPSSGRSSAKSLTRPDPKRRYVERIAAMEEIVQSFHEPGGSKIPDVSNEYSPGDEATELFRKWRKVSPLNDTPGNRSITGETLGNVAGSLTPSAVISNHSLQPTIEINLEQLFSESRGGRYVNTCLLDVLQHEVGGPNMALDLDGRQVQPPTGDGLGFHLHMCDSQQLNVRHEQVAHLWYYFKARVDPIMKVLYVPSMELVMTAASNLQPVSREAEALIFAISYIAIRSLTADECMFVFGESRDALSAYYRLGYEQASARAEFVEATNLATMQAHILYLAALRSEADARAMWTMMGLASRAAQSFGLHRDGVHWSHLSPFSIEMRRRLWWQLLELEARISEDNGRAPLIAETRFDTQMPLNVDDADLSENMDELPKSRRGLTEMTFSLIAFELTNTLRFVLLSLEDPSSQSPKDLHYQSNGKERKDWVIQSHQRIEQTYLANLDVSQPFAWVAFTYARLVMSKMWLVVYTPATIPHEIAELPANIVGKLFEASLEAIEEGNRLDNDPRAGQWRWHFGKDLQWHSIILLLSELSRHSSGDLVDRAWNAIEGLVRGRFQGERNGPHQQVLLWQLIRRLLIKARMTREKKFMEELRLRGEGLYANHPRPLDCHPAIDKLLANESRVKPDIQEQRH
ncbi:hypothetical protein FOMG_18276 [Fusarium oxysporum f. sp. melonis 26406]|uniref:Xylanolytic transcriptional activator regulatory domain-containing protein n=1 Tax=Fusarium oxysporum f. sp. melonis 26406 TaxID=1089452 RepID=W9YZU0_FUSOX|nr:hypothetical protein FOMG_18276 [Fusarium oxysporum f. sp. melonis 26406]